MTEIYWTRVELVIFNILYLFRAGKMAKIKSIFSPTQFMIRLSVPLDKQDHKL